MKVVIPAAALAALAACAGPPAKVQAPSPVVRLASAEVAGQVRRCYRSPRVPSEGRRIVTRLLVRYGPDGALIGLPMLVGQQGVTPESLPYAGKMVEAAKQAVLRCSPIRLPEGLGKRPNKDFVLTFSPQVRA